MKAETRSTEGPSLDLRFRRRLRPGAMARELWRSRELVRTLAERDIRARYKQAVLGVAWAVLTPLALVAVFTIFLRRTAQIDTGGTPYPLFAYLGVIPWTFFATSMSQGGQSIVANVSLLNKVYCPREVFPIASVLVSGVDTVLAMPALIVMFVATGFAPRATSVWVPLLIGVEVAFTVGITMVISALVVYFRDIRHALTILLQLGLLATPVAYSIEVIPASVRGIYCFLNPIAPVIDGLRRSVLLGQPPDLGTLGIGAASALLTLIVGYLLFKRLETGFADVA